MIDLVTLIRKEIFRFLKVWKQSLIPPVVNTFLYLIIFGSFIGSQIKDVDWVWYMDYIIPWLIMMSVITSSYMNTSFSFFISKLHKNIEELFVSPISNLKILIWFVLWWVARWFIVWFLIFAISLIFSDVQIFSYLYFFWFLFLTSVLFSLAWLLNWIYAKTFDDINMIPTFVITPLIYLWWVFYSITMLWDFWQSLSQLNPVLYMINWFRYWYIWVSDVNTFFSLFIILFFILIFSFWCYYLLRKWHWIRD